MNLKIQEFKNAIMNFAINYDLPSEVKRLCFLDILKNFFLIDTITSEISTF